ncbi:hypothetical protein FS749_005561 [Ceratobasidium sp. UAMH 11750]|nr:hypothetical protein FS749_005561 [Ceratobasidium sp. UAMH 11750]
MDLDPPPAPAPPPPPAAEPNPLLRQRFIDAAKKHTHRQPYDWQLDIAEALHNRRDVFCIASTGSGKTLPYILNTLIDPRTLVWLVSPLNYIEQQQEKTFKEWNIRACSVNATTSYPGIYKVYILPGTTRDALSS